MRFEVGSISARTGNLMEWNVSNVSNAFKNLKEIETKSMMDMTIIPSIDPIDIALGSSEKGNIGPGPPGGKPRKKTMTSLYLKFFETAPDGKSRKCKFCKQNYSIATATGNLGRHLNHRHPGYDRLGEPGMQVPQAVTVSKKPPPQAKPISVDFDNLNWLLLKWVIGSSLPPSTFEDDNLSNSFKFLNSSATFWAKERVQAVTLEVFRSMREDVRASLEQVNSKVSITLDLWTSYEQVSYMSITGHWIDENWSLHKVLLDISHIPFPLGGTEIYQTLTKVLKMFNIDRRILSCTHDNSPAAIHACHTLKEELDGTKVPFCYIPCAARTLNLIIEDGLRTAKPVLAKIREFVLEMNTSLEITQDFLQIATAYQEGTWKFPLDASMRWSGHYTMLDIVRKAYSSMDTVIRKHDETLGSRNLLLNTAEKNAVNIMHSYLEPFYKTTNDLSSSKFPTMGLVLFFMDHVTEMITACRDAPRNPDWLKGAADDMAKKSRNYTSQVYNPFMYMAVILDPRMKGEYVPDTLNSESNLEEARSQFVRNYSTSHFPTTANGYSVCQDNGEGSTSISFAEEIARKRRRGTVSPSTDELTQYLSEPTVPWPTDVLEWWKLNSMRYPRLSIMARDFLAVQATSVAPDELFSSKGDEVDKQRICLCHSSMQPIMCIRSWTQSGYKLKFRSTEIDYEKLIEPAVSVTPLDGTSYDRK